MKRRLENLLGILKKRGFSSFETDVYREVCSIPWGKTRSYRWVARKVGLPNGPRAVGQALKKNPFPFIIPCHRVIKENGSLGGFSCGIALKKRLLRVEKAVIIKRKGN